MTSQETVLGDSHDSYRGPNLQCGFAILDNWRQLAENATGKKQLAENTVARIAATERDVAATERGVLER